MGTRFEIRLYASGVEIAEKAKTAAFARVAELNAILSDYVPDSDLNRLCASEPGVPIPARADLFHVIATAQELAHATDGAFDVTSGHYTQNWRRSLRKNSLPSPDTLAHARKRTGYRHLSLDSDAGTITLHQPGMRLDLGGIAKGFAADQALVALRAHGITRAAVAAGGDIAAGDPPPGKEGWDVGILSMDRAQESLSQTAKLANAAVSTSGDREQFVEIEGIRYAHIVDPRTGLGLTRRITASVIAPTAIRSDSHATVLCILGVEKGLALIEATPGLEALIITEGPDGTQTRHRSSGFPAK